VVISDDHLLFANKENFLKGLDMASKLNRQQTEAKINVRAWKDPAFKKKLKSAPHAALKEMGMKKIPSSLDIQTAEEKKNQWIIRLRERPLNFNELSEEALEKIAAGEPQEATCCPKSPI
jgi:hypothetical protein